MIDDLLNILADGRFHSGRELGEQLGVSRSAVWKQIHHIQESGIEVYSVKGRGYRIPGGLDLLSLENIEAQLSHEVKAQLQRITLEQSIPSTNAAAMQSIYEHGHGSLYLAEQQTAGRGRRAESHRQLVERWPAGDRRRSRLRRARGQSGQHGRRYRPGVRDRGPVESRPQNRITIDFLAF